MIDPVAIVKALQRPKSNCIEVELDRVLAEINEGARSTASVRPLSTAEMRTIRISLASLFRDLATSSYVCGKHYLSIAPVADERGLVEALAKAIQLRQDTLGGAFAAMLDERLLVEIQRVRGTYDLRTHATLHHDVATGALLNRSGKLDDEIARARSALTVAADKLGLLTDARPELRGSARS